MRNEKELKQTIEQIFKKTIIVNKATNKCLWVINEKQWNNEKQGY